MGWLKPPQLCAGRQMILAWSRLVALGAELSEMRRVQTPWFWAGLWRLGGSESCFPRA